MQGNRYLISAAAIAAGLAVLACAPDATAQYSGMLEMQKRLEERLAEKIQVLADTELKASWLMTMTILIVVLGAVTASLQKLQRRWTKPATAAAGLAVAVITGVVGIVFPTDYRALRVAAFEVREKIERARDLLAEVRGKDDSNARTTVHEIQKLLAGISDIERKIQVGASYLELLPTAHAGDAPSPAWVRDRRGPADRGGIYQFVGEAESTDLGKAKELSLRDAIERAANVLAAQLGGAKLEQRAPAEAGAIRDYVRRSAAPADTYFTRDAPSGRYQYFTLIKLDKSFLAPEVVRFMLPAGPIKVIGQSQVKQRHRTLLGGEFERKVAVYVGDVEQNAAFRMLIYVPKANALVMNDEHGMLPTAMVRGEAQSVLLDRRVDPKSREVEFDHNQKSYRLVFDAVERRFTDLVVFEVFRK